MTSVDSVLLHELEQLRKSVQLKDEIIAAQCKQLSHLQARNTKLEQGVQHRDTVIRQLATSRKLAFSTCRTFTEQVIQETDQKVDKMRRQLELERQHIADLYKDLKAMRFRYQNNKSGGSIWSEEELDLSDVPDSPATVDDDDSVIDVVLDDEMCLSPPSSSYCPELSSSCCSKEEGAEDDDNSSAAPTLTRNIVVVRPKGLAVKPKPGTLATTITTTTTTKRAATSTTSARSSRSRVLCSWAGDGNDIQQNMKLEELLDEIFAEESINEADTDAYVTW